MNNLKVGVIQLNSRGDKEKNLQIIRENIKMAANDGSQLICLPEYSSYLSDFEVIENAESLDGYTVNFYKKLSQKHGIYIHCGSFIEKSEEKDRAYNTSLLFNPKGKIIGRYRKIHLFDVDIPGQFTSKESNKIKPGEKITSVETEIGNMGFSICYDLRFPELYRVLINKGVQVIFVPAAFTMHTGKDHWEALIRARAIENQVYIIAPAQFGKYPKNNECYGNSMVVDPWGTVIARAPNKVGYITVDIDLKYQNKIKKVMPCLSHAVL